MTIPYSPPPGVLVAFAAYAFFSFGDASIKMLHGALPFSQVSFIGSLFGLLALPFLKTKNDSWFDMVKTSNRPLWLLRFVCGATASLGCVVAFTLLPMAEALALLFLLPTFVTILSVIFLHEEVHWQRWTAVIVGFVGILIVLRPGFRELSIGHLCAAIGGLSAAISIVVFRAMGPSEARLSLYGAAVLGVLCISGLLMISNLVLPTARQWLVLASYGLCGGAADILLINAARMAPASLVAAPQYSQMIWAIGFGALIFHDHIDAAMALGILLIISSGLLTLLRDGHQDDHPARIHRFTIAKLAAALKMTR